jgi:ABC-type multidrug transport system fused ATPase/permease subunit
VRWAIDGGITQGNQQVLVAPCDGLGLYLSEPGINWIYLWAYHAYEADAGRDLRNSMYRGLQRLSFGYLDRSDTGQLIARATSDTEAVQHFFGHGSTGVVSSVGTYVITLAFAFTVSWQLTLLAMITVPLMLWAGVNYSNVSSPLFAKVQQQYGALTGLQRTSPARVVNLHPGARVARYAA